MAGFDLEEVKEVKERARPTSWHYLLAPWDEGGGYSLKMEIHDGGGSYGPWSRIYNRVLDKLGGKNRKSKAQSRARNLQFSGRTDQDSKLKAEKAAVEGTDVVQGVAQCGPVFEKEEELDAWAAGEKSVTYGTKGKTYEPTPRIREKYIFAGGKWRIPEEAEPPDEWISRPGEEQVEWLKNQDAFCAMVALERAILENEAGERDDDEESEKNFETGPSTRAQNGG